MICYHIEFVGRIREKSGMPEKPHYLIVAGEASGDIHGGALMRAVRSRLPEVVFYGVGGDEMSAAGVDLLFHVRDMGVTGFTEVLGKLPAIFRIMKSVSAAAVERKPSAAILIDYPDFNLRLAKRLHRAGIPVIYYVSPQLWAWRSSRVNLIRRVVKKMLVLFPFEEDWYHQRDVDAVFVGNPILDRIIAVPDRDICRRELGFGDTFTLAMLPGSRGNELRRMLPVMMAAMQKLASIRPDIRWVLPVASTISRNELDPIISSFNLVPEIIEDTTPQVMKGADFVWVTSGTATLETALAGTPMIIGYKTSIFSYYLAKWLINIEYIGIANLVAGRAVSPELIQDKCSPENWVSFTREIIEDPSRMAGIRKDLASIRSSLGEPGAADRAAREILISSGFEDVI